MMNHGKVIKFLDRTFNIKKDFTLEIFQFILDHHQPNNDFQFEITADIVHPDIIQFIQEKIPKGLFRFEIGIQTVNQKANLEVSRKQNFEKTKSIILQLRDYVDLHLDLIVGLPLDEWEDIRYSFEEVFKLYAPELQLGFLKFLKGTPMRIKTQEHGYIYDPHPPYEIIQSKYLSAEQLADIRLAEHCLEIYWNKPRAKNMCAYITQHYSIFDFFVALGKYIDSRKKFHQLHLIEIFTYAMELVKEYFPEDMIVQQMIALDYLLAFKVRPKVLFEIFMDNKFVNKLALEHHIDIIKFRYRLMPIHFNLYEWVTNKKIIQQDSIAWIKYDGIKYPTIFFLPEESLERV
jgi:hypothetical protein